MRAIGTLCANTGCMHKTYLRNEKDILGLIFTHKMPRWDMVTMFWRNIWRVENKFELNACHRYALCKCGRMHKTFKTFIEI